MRVCPLCCAEIFHTNKYNCRRAVALGRLCKVCGAKKAARSGEANGFYGKSHTETTRSRLSVAQSATQLGKTDEERLAFRERMQSVWEIHHAGRPRKSNYQYWVDRWGKERADRLAALDSLRKSIANSGFKNPMFGKAPPPGAGNGWQGWLEGKFFRSLGELRFMLDNPDAESAERKDWRATYIDAEGVPHTTVADFMFSDKRLLVECKPKPLHSTEGVLRRVKALSDLATSRGYRFVMLDPGVVEFEELRLLIESGKVILTERTKGRYEKWQS